MADTAQLADWAEQAARLAKADLVTEMVGEFPELQGLMGGYYARAEGLPEAVADAIRDHYKPVGQGDEVPTAPVTVAVSLADKLDTLFHFFLIDERPTGSKDPFALRRSALGIIRICTTNSVRLSLMLAGLQNLSPSLWQKRRDDERAPLVALADAMLPLITPDSAKPMIQALAAAAKSVPSVGDFDHVTLENSLKASASVRDFITERLEVVFRDLGISADLVRAAKIIDGDRGKDDDIVRLEGRVKALQNFVATPDGQNLLAAYKRAANILKKEGWDEGRDGTDRIARTGEEDPLALVDDPDMAAVVDARMAEKKKISLSYTPEPAEKALIEALDTAEPRAAHAVEEERFEDAMGALATLRAPIDAFFEEVTVNAEEEDKRAARLGLLARFRDAVDRVADFSRIEG